jgi:hypothetical protein
MKQCCQLWLRLHSFVLMHPIPLFPRHNLLLCVWGAQIGVDTSIGLLLANFGAAMAAGVWRLLLIPLDTCKTVLQVEGANGFARLVRRVRRGEVSPGDDAGEDLLSLTLAPRGASC